jgi:hypothetical protein
MGKVPATAPVLAPSRRLARAQHSALAWFPLLALACVIAASTLTRLRDAPADPLALDAPALPEPHARCQSPVEVSGQRAMAAERAAMDKVARYPFVPGEGLRALELFSEAENCATAAGDRAGAARARGRSQVFHRRLSAEYRDRLTRYRRARVSQRPRQALSEVVFLLELFSAQDGPFPVQLRRVRLELDAELAKEKKG